MHSEEVELQEQLEKMLTLFPAPPCLDNIFTFINLLNPRNENFQTIILKWLLSNPSDYVNGNYESIPHHGIGTEFLKEFLRCAKISLAETDVIKKFDVTLQPSLKGTSSKEHGIKSKRKSPDLYVEYWTDKGYQGSLVIENKLSGSPEKQLNIYRDLVRGCWPGAVKPIFYIGYVKRGVECTNPENRVVTYKAFADRVEPHLASIIQPFARSIVDQWVADIKWLSEVVDPSFLGQKNLLPKVLYQLWQVLDFACKSPFFVNFYDSTEIATEAGPWGEKILNDFNELNFETSRGKGFTNYNLTCKELKPTVLSGINFRIKFNLGYEKTDITGQLSIDYLEAPLESKKKLWILISSGIRKCKLSTLDHILSKELEGNKESCICSHIWFSIKPPFSRDKVARGIVQFLREIRACYDECVSLYQFLLNNWMNA